MSVEAMEPFGRALRAYAAGDSTAELLLCRDDGQRTELPVRHFFRGRSELWPIEIAAIEQCRGAVLDIGAGSGLHSVLLAERGLAVTALDIDPEALEIMRRRGLRDVRRGDILTFSGGPFDTLLMLGHTIGMVETIAGLDRLLAHARGLLRDGGQLLVDSIDVRVTDDSEHLAYQEANRAAGRYIGEIRLRFEFRGTRGPYCGWLHVDAETLEQHAKSAGWSCVVLRQEANGEYLARLVKGAA